MKRTTHQGCHGEGYPCCPPRLFSPQTSGCLAWGARGSMRPKDTWGLTDVPTAVGVGRVRSSLLTSKLIKLYILCQILKEKTHPQTPGG